MVVIGGWNTLLRHVVLIVCRIAIVNCDEYIGGVHVNNCQLLIVVLNDNHFSGIGRLHWKDLVTVVSGCSCTFMNVL